MKKSLLLLIIFLSVNVYAQKSVSDTLVIDKIPASEFLLTKGWKFYAGDNPAFAKPDYNDYSWPNINPSSSQKSLPAAARHGIGWMRVKIEAPAAVWQSVSLRVINNTALEVYVDGVLAGRRGAIDASRKDGRGYFDRNEPVRFPASTKTAHLIAIRYAWQPGLGVFSEYQFPSPGILSARLLKTNDFAGLRDVDQNFAFVDLAFFSVLLLLAFFHFTLYWYNRENRGNLYFACYSLCVSLCMFGSVRVNLPCNITVFVYWYLLTGVAFTIGYLFGIKALYTLFKFPIGRVHYFLAAIIVLLSLADTVVPVPRYYITISGIFIFAFQFWLSTKAVWFKVRGANIIAVGYTAGLFGAIIYTLGHMHLVPEIAALIAICFAVLGPVLGISVYLGREFALDALLLKSKLHEVEDLSALTIAQEQEKQALLAAQNELLEKQVIERTAELHQSLTDLKQTQTQLIQTEKMASLGELTAGIAHEIQNPLNFVNNFSEVNTELIDEMQLEIEKGDLEEIKAIALDIRENEKKINMHGKRADSIVKGMLEHSRSSSGQKEPTDLNAMADEYMRLSYHGLRAKDKTFNTEMVTHFDANLPKINVIPQDIGRVLLNLFNNAFYAVNLKQKTLSGDYKPEVTVTTFAENNHISIKVKDNGIGIPDAIKDKIMQPFFTTKPTGEGTGLGLSLTYDMVVKGHGGSITVNTEEGEFTVFIVDLPI